MGNADACGFTPAFSPDAITVGSIDRYDYKSDFSCFGRCVNIWAPGSDIESARHSGGSTEMSGTSMACPHVSGAVALMLGEEPSMKVDQVKRKLEANAVSGSIRGLTRGDDNLLLS